MAVKKLSRWSRFLICFCFVSALLVMNISIFTVRSSANAVDDIEEIYVVGLPLNLYASCYVGSEYTSFNTVINDLTLYLDDASGNPRWYGGIEYSDSVRYLYNIIYSTQSATPGAADVFVSPSVPMNVTSVECIYPFVSDRVGLSDYASTFAFYGQTDDIEVRYTYNYLTNEVLPDGSLNWFQANVKETVTISAAGSGSYTEVPVLNRNVLDNSFFANAAKFTALDKKVCYFTSFEIQFLTAVPVVSQFYLNADNRIPMTLSEFKRDMSFNQALIQDGPSIVDFDDISWTEWLVNSVGSFMNFEFIPGFSISGIFALLVGMSLFMVFLKVFAGG